MSENAPQHHLAQFNIGRVRAPIGDPLMAGFVAQLDDVNALADGAPGFVWRLQTEEGNATSIHAFEDERLLLNMSVWTSVEALRNFAYAGRHLELLRDRAECSRARPARTKCCGGCRRGTRRPSRKRSGSWNASRWTGRPRRRSRSSSCFRARNRRSRPWASDPEERDERDSRLHRGRYPDGHHVALENEHVRILEGAFRGPRAADALSPTTRGDRDRRLPDALGGR